MLDLFQIFILITLLITSFTLICSANNGKEPEVLTVTIEKKQFEEKEILPPIKEECEENVEREKQLSIIRKRLQPKGASSSREEDSSV